METESVRDFITRLVRALCTHPDEVTVSEQALPGGFMFYAVSTAQVDRGRVIGTGGQNLSSVRKIAEAFALKQKLPMPQIQVTEN